MIDKRSSFSSLVFILFSVCTSWVVMALVFPEQFVLQQMSFIRFSDIAHNYQGVFTFLSNLFHGGIALWNPYDQMPLMFYYAVGGITQWSNLMVAAVYALFVRFSPFPGEFYYTMYARLYYVFAIFISTSGMYLLFQRFTKHRGILFISMVWGSSILLPQVFLGLSAGSLYSFFPLLAHFILRFFEEKRLSHLLFFLLLLTVCVAMDAELALGYFYLAVHFFFLITLVWFLIKERKHIRSILQRRSQFSFIVAVKRWFPAVLLTIILCLLVIGPWIYLLLANYKDYDVAHEQNRFKNLNPFSAVEYFSRPYQVAPVVEFLPRLIDFSQNRWDYSWLFLGFSVVFLGIATLIFATDQRKFVFIGTLFLFVWINMKRESFGPLSLLHWVTLLTNPFNMVVRSYHMTGAFLSPFLFSVFFPLGLQGLLDAANSKPTRRLFLQVSMAALILFFYVVAVFRAVPQHAQLALVIGFVVSLMILLLICMQSATRTYRLAIIAMLVMVLLFLDGRNMSVYIRDITKRILATAHQIPTMQESVFLDYQNPLVLPFRYHYTDMRIPDLPGYLLVDAIYNHGSFYRYTDLYKYFTPATHIRPRHASYTPLSQNAQLQQYIQADSRLIFQADVAMTEDAQVFQRILDAGISRKVVLVESKALLSENTVVASFPNEIRPNPKPTTSSMRRIEFLLHQGERIERDTLDLFLFSLPSSFSQHLTTSVFTKDQAYFQVTLGEKFLSPAQGSLIHPFSFDVANIAEGKLAIAVPRKYDGSQDIVFAYREFPSSGITRISLYEPDRLHFDYHAQKTGWLVFHYPFDPKWRLIIDGVRVPLYRVNYSFLGTPIQEGAHTVALSYWPNPLFRHAIAFSLILIALLPLCIIWIAIQREKYL